MSNPTVPYRDMKAIDESILGLRRAVGVQRVEMTTEEHREIDATLLYFWNYCVNPNLIELENGTVLHVPESGYPDEYGRAMSCTECGHGAYIKGEDLCGNCLPMEWHDKQKETTE